ncbi:MFS transporter [Bradyrhizobium arachidis]|uniref:MFS transporter n=1 Tax=Bradyrhizobium TaxID=374 RepID=UPI0004078A89
MIDPSRAQTFSSGRDHRSITLSDLPTRLVASLIANLGILMQGVGPALSMTQMTSFADQVALVQTALLLPIMPIAIPAGAVADMHALG